MDFTRPCCGTILFSALLFSLAPASGEKRFHIGFEKAVLESARSYPDAYQKQGGGSSVQAASCLKTRQQAGPGEEVVSVRIVRLLSCASLFLAWLYSSGPAAAQFPTPGGRGAGFVIGSGGEVLTNARVVDGCDDVQAKRDGKTATASIVARDAVNDVALLRLNGPMPGGPAIRTTAPQTGEQIVTLGFASRPEHSREAIPAVGRITALMGSTPSSLNDTRLLQISAPTFQDDSGSPLLDVSGHVIGVVSWQPGPTGGAFHRDVAIKSAVVQAFLDAHGVPYRTSGPSSPLEAADIGEEAKGYTFLIECIKRPRVARKTPPQTRQEPAQEQRSAATVASAPGVQADPRAVLYEEDPTHPSGFNFAGTVIWRTEQASAPGQKPGVIIHADIDVPHKLSVRWSLERNDDKGLRASHVAKMTFSFAPDSDRIAVSSVPGVMMRQGETTSGVALNGASAKVSDNFFLVGLSAVAADVMRNVQLLKERAWVGIPIVYGDGKRALLVVEKGAGGTRAFEDAFAAWETAGEAADASPNVEMQPEPKSDPAPATAQQLSVPPAPDPPVLPGTLRAALENADGRKFTGTVTWRTERAVSSQDQKPDVVVHADIEIPHVMSLQWSLERNDNGPLPANHLVRLRFTMLPDARHGGVEVPDTKMMSGGKVPAAALHGVAVKIADNFFLVGLSILQAERERNMELLESRSWIHIPVVYGDGRQATLSFEKGDDGMRAIADALAAWDAAGEANAEPAMKKGEGQTEP
jgi:S1-C subfamily serine protease